jgi:hypothetical protein
MERPRKAGALIMGLFGWLRRMVQRDAVPPAPADMLGAATLVKETAPDLSVESPLPHVVIAQHKLSPQDERAKQARGYRNKNPGNIDFNERNKWRGQIGREQTGNPPRFAVFDSHENGIRALARLLQTYQVRHDLHTIAGIINRWAPSNENNTSAYVTFVSRAMGIEPDEQIDVFKWNVARPMVEAIIRKELGGNPYPPEVIDEGVSWAGVMR